MTKIDNFKLFVRKNPNLVTQVRNNTTSWQELYEIYDLYGEENEVWKNYIIKEERRTAKTISKTTTNNTFNNIIEMAKNIDTVKLQDGITSMQKAISLFGDMLIKDKAETNTYTPRPIYRKFDD